MNPPIVKVFSAVIPYFIPNKRFLVKTVAQGPMIYSRKGVKMNKVLKMLIKESIHNNVLDHVKTNSGDKYSVFDRYGREILSIDNGWAKNNYSISINKKTVLAVRWDETNEKPLTKDQKDMIDIINACKEKIDLQETAQTMTNHELEMANFLQRSLCKI